MASLASSPLIAVGQTIGNYMITAKLGEGGMGVVYLAEHPVIGRKVAMKAIHPELSRNPEVVSRFVTEAKAVNQIGNEHIVDIHDFGTTADGDFYFIMEFLQGEALADRMRREAPMDPARALDIAAQVADALAASHAHGIIHRDLKPENIFLIHKGGTSDFVKVLDFGLAKLTLGADKVSHKTRTGSVMGTPYYMSPEQCEGRPNIDQRADVYSLGVILFEMMTGKVPFGGEGYGEIIVKHITAPVPSPRGINPRLSAAHEAILLRALAKNRDERFHGMEDFRVAMMNPERYAAAPSMVPTPGPLAGYGAEPSRLSDGNPSGAVVVGDLGARAAPMPSTFREAAGAVEGEDAIPKSHGALLVGILAAALVAGGVAAFLVVRTGSISQPATVQKAVSTPAPAPVPVPPPLQAAPAPPAKVSIKFRSEPVGAAVARKDTGEQLGVTPFEIEVPRGQSPLAVVFKKSNFKDVSRSIVPQESGLLDATLEAAASPAPIPTPRTARSGAKSATGKSGGARRGKSGRAMDEDGVLAPSF
ncbi:MAG TPA: serine/threonine-protein kinase [Polyangia bacterium]|nr:serine/threonine-protein kinase [Polyangia bacterium]